MSRHGVDRVRSVYLKAKAALSSQSVSETLRVGSETFNALQPFIDSPTVFNFFRGAFNVAKTLSDRERWYREEYFDDEDDWLEAYSRDFNEVIKAAVSSLKYKMISDKADKQIKIVELGDGCRVGWTIRTNMQSYSSPVYVNTPKYKESQEKIKKLLWKHYKEKSIVLRKNNSSAGSVHGSTCNVSFEADVLYKPMVSKRATEYSAYLKRFIDAGVPRAVLLYGPPGTGKSTMATTMVDTLKLKSFRIRISDMSHLQNTTLFEAINIFEPEVVILDDFDRADDQESLLETLEFFQKKVKLIIATANHKDALDDAILRPGRFDELIEIKKLDTDVIKSILGVNHNDVFDEVKDWPVAYVQEYVKRATFMTTKEAKETVLELKKRVDKLVSKYADEDEE